MEKMDNALLIHDASSEKLEGEDRNHLMISTDGK